MSETMVQELSQSELTTILIAVTVAAVKYGISSEQWLPASRYAVATLGTALLQNAAIDASLLLKRGPEQGE